MAKKKQQRKPTMQEVLARMDRLSAALEAKVKLAVATKPVAAQPYSYGSWTATGH